LPLDLARLFLCPGALFARLPQHNPYPSALLLLVLLHVLFGSAVLSTGLVDYDIDRRARHDFARVAHHLEVDLPDQWADSSLKAVQQRAGFEKLLARLGWLLGGPLCLGAGVAFTAAFLFVVVALGGRKPDLPLLAGVITFASFAEAARLLVVLFLVWQRQTLRVDLSAAVCAGGQDVGLPAYLLLRCLDPFALWYWALLGIGLWKTGQADGITACRAVLVLAALTVLGHVVLDLFTLTDLGRWLPL
jgi:hypothetical protein